MNSSTQRLECPHCEALLQPFKLPDNTGWQGDFQIACFNDECPYYVRGWNWMMENYSVKASYRFRVDPESGGVSPLAVWSADALKEQILDADVLQSLVSKDATESEEVEGSGE